jgi:pimeloyl-ACP methyl ester carboxylesterase
VTVPAAALFAVVAGAAGRVAAEPAARHLIYLHGRIVQDEQHARPRHPEWGYYELEKILAALREKGFQVTGEIRPREATLDQSADRVAGQVRALRAAGVPLERITILGGSMGAAIAFRASERLAEPGLRVAVLGACFSLTVEAIAKEYARPPAGRFLTIRDRSDETSEPCPAWRDDPARYPQLRAREVVIDTGQSHGFLYRPLEAWLEPFLEWAGPR